MREIKFRAWHKALKEYLNPDEWTHYGPLIIGGDLSSTAHYVEQFTGLLDKNGTEIYEGDIYTHGSDTIRYKVIYRGDQFIGNQVGNKSLAGITAWLPRIEVIGNIHENPELLEA